MQALVEIHAMSQEERLNELLRQGRMEGSGVESTLASR